MEYVPIVFLAGSVAIWVGYTVARHRGYNVLGGQAAPPAPWTDVDLWLVLAIFLGQQVISSLVLGHMLRKAGPTIGPEGLFFYAFSPRLFWQLSLSCLGNVVTVVAVLLIATRHPDGRVAQLGLTAKRPVRQVMLGLAGMVAILPVVYGLLWLSEVLLPLPSPRHPIQETLAHGAAPEVAVMAMLAGLVAAPLGEELIFRGFLQGWLRRRVGPSVAIGITAGLFGLMHAALPLTVLPLAVLGVALGYLYERSGSLLVPVTLHFAFNAVPTLDLILAHV